MLDKCYIRQKNILFFFDAINFCSGLFVFRCLFASASVSVLLQCSEDETVDPSALFNQGQDAHEKGDFNTALKFYDEAVKLAPDFPEAEYQRGNALQSLGKIAEAEKAFRRAMELREDWTLPMTSLGKLLIDTNNFVEAEKVLSNAIKLDRQNFPAYSALTELRLKSKASPKLYVQLLGKIQNLTSKANPTASIWAARAALESKLGDKKAAKQSLVRALSIEPENSFALSEKIEVAGYLKVISRARWLMLKHLSD